MEEGELVWLEHRVGRGPQRVEEPGVAVWGHGAKLLD